MGTRLTLAFDLRRSRKPVHHARPRALAHVPSRQPLVARAISLSPQDLPPPLPLLLAAPIALRSLAFEDVDKISAKHLLERKAPVDRLPSRDDRLRCRPRDVFHVLVLDHHGEV